ncbi:uracil-DNA glycosylase-like protein [Radiomyces spectabilis]|uniref:uracil-DNA glycosylase-like protein n=1 Tax=Radiomyces spectabilis TaxID=64574 RepID=UPI00222068C6|nr:uracil-DNA glycosylase-like protein [Radiomyces spectabilis]KAI8388931.1 uracil-DNA glycosylase-like protein [Radiomyces spectabilis]
MAAIDYTIPDLIRHHTEILFIGINPSSKAPKKHIGHFFGGRGNCFWKCFSECGLLDGIYGPLDDVYIHNKYNVGFLNLVPRATASCKSLARDEILLRVQQTLAKIERFKPKLVCCVGKFVYQHLIYSPRGKVAFGIQSTVFPWENGQGASPVFLMPSTSKIGIAYSEDDKKR